ncbi:putative F-box/FBD/LRR-repeat protein At4g03220 [Humulus lupulus]|uniref:putative F-box/FBD/LRR-repeat protein At4g03220 n=1 Tax=Humulus lupulus TaxID=3486 RepID=UPI002B415928|nr:putative F-box/FBD/LRR-repeat protein At4g03220 [Humulus lupulus]
METRSSTRKGKLWRFIYGEDKNGSSPTIDRISELPDALIHHILTLLPTKTVAQTSLLSKRWRSIWYTFPDLDFDFTSDPFSPSKRFTKNSIYSRKAYYDGLTDPISQVFNLRDKIISTSSTAANSADIRSLRVRTTNSISFSRLNDVIRRAVRHNVQQLDLDVITDEHIIFPRSVILSESLRVLSLKSRCSAFRFPPDLSVMKSGFRSLVSLSLSNVVLIDNDHRLLDLFSHSSFPMMSKLSMDCCLGLKHLRIGCGALEEFELKCCIALQSLEICCPKLQTLKVQTCFEEYNDDGDDGIVSWVNIEAPKLRTLVWEENAVTDSSSLVDLRKLEEATIGTLIGFGYHENVSLAKLQSLSDFLAGFAYVRCLKFGEGNFLEILSDHLYLGERLNPFENLRTLELHLDVKNDTVYGGLACIFRSSPMLHTLILKYINKIERKRKWKSDDSFDCEEFWESQAETLKLFFHHLQIVRIHGVFKSEKEVRLPRFLLRHGKALHEMTFCITQHPFYNRNIILAQASPRRQNIFRSRVMGWPRASSNANITIR